MLIRDVAITEHETFMEACAWLALNRAIHERGDGAKAVHAPDWLAVGVAQDLEAPLRMRNGTLMRAVVREEQVPSLNAILNWTHLPQGRWMEKAICGRLIRWLFDYPEHQKRLNRLFARAAEEGNISLDHIAEFTGHVNGAAADAA